MASRTKNAPATTDNGSTALVDQSPSSAAFLDFQEQFEDLLHTPFLPKTDAARMGTPFAVLSIQDRIERDPETQVETPQWILLVELQRDEKLAKKNTGEVVEFAAGDHAILTLDKGDVRDRQMTNLQKLLEQYRRIDDCVLKEIPNKDARKSASIVLTHVSLWNS